MTRVCFEAELQSKLDLALREDRIADEAEVRRRYVVLRGTRREFVLKTVKATPQTTVGLLGQDDKTVEYRPDLKPKSAFQQEADGMHVRVRRAQ